MEKSNLKYFTKSLRSNQTPWETKLWMQLRGNRFLGYKFKRQVPIGKYIIDFCCQERRLVIELDGSQHTENDVSVGDRQKEIFLEEHGYKVLRFWNNELVENLEGVLEKIKNTLDDLSPNLSPSPGERGMIDPQVNTIIQDIFKQFDAVFKAHSGGAEVVAADDQTIVLRLKGHCEGCALAPLTFGLGIEKLIREKIPTIKEIRYTS